MKIGKLPKKVSEDELLSEFEEISNTDEVIEFACEASFFVSAKILIVTNQRMLFLEPKNFEILKQVNLEDIADTKTAGGFSGTFNIKTNNSKLIVFSITVKDDRQYLNSLIVKFRPQEVSEEIASGKVGWTKVRIFKSGYVTINDGVPEKLMAISSSVNVSKKTGAGQAIGQTALFLGSAGVLSGGTSNRRGDVYLTIVTELKTHSLHEDLNSVSASLKNYESEKTVLELEAAGNAALNQLQNFGNEINEMASNPFSLSEELSNIKNLYDSGVLTKEEFEKAKHKLLEN